jgi:hypothetical protein
VPEGVPVRFLALEWQEGWELDHPSVLLEPVVRYSPYGDSCEKVIKDAVLGVAIDYGFGLPTMHRDVGDEFAWQKWSLAWLHRVAVACLAGKQFPTKQYRAVERWVVFRKSADGAVDFEYAPMPRRPGR